MILKKHTGQNKISYYLSEIQKNKKRVIFALYSCLIFILGVLAHRVGVVRDVVKPIVFESYQRPIRYVKGFTAKPEHIIIDIKHTNFQKLAYQREKALLHNYLDVSGNEYVPADIRYKNKTIKVGLRLKGDLTDHLQSDKWSFRIKVKGNNTLFGMKQFSIHHPKTRNYIYEWIYHKALKREDVLSLRYEFITVTLNGKNLGVYALEEHFEKRLIEYNRRREGPIIRFNENLMWDEILEYKYPFPRSKRSGYGAYLSSDIDAFHTKKILSDSTNYLLFIKAVNLLESFRRGKLKTSNVFDVRKLAAFFAITDLMGAEHGSRWHNARLYYNPVSSHLEPIGFDGDSGQIIKSICGTLYGIYIGRDSKNIDKNNIYYPNFYYPMLFNDETFFREYIKALERVSTPLYLDSLLCTIRDELNENLKIIYKEFPFYHFDENILYRNQKYIRTFLNPMKALHVYFHRSMKDGIEIELGNIQSMPIEVLNVTYKDSIIFVPERRILISVKVPLELVDYQNVKFLWPKGFSWSDTMKHYLKVHYKLLGTSRLKQEDVNPWSYLEESFIAVDFIRQPSNINDFEFLSVNEKTKRLIFKSGQWDVTHNLIIPEGYTVIADEGLKLNLLHSAKILTYSAIIFNGSELNPINVYSSDFTGQGLVVVNAYRESLLEYTNFKNLSNASQSGWELTGAVTFYESPVKISHCHFTENKSEDALNIIRSKFEIENTTFSKNIADAIDADFTKGKIRNSSFIECGNDAFDISGSIVEMKNIFIDRVGDKGISVGENSKTNANQIKIINAEIAVASKDLSEIIVQDIRLYENEVGFTAFQKKPEFGSASITVSDLKLDKVSVPYLIENGSSVTVDGRIISPNQDSVKDILYGVKYGKSSD